MKYPINISKLREAMAASGEFKEQDFDIAKYLSLAINAAYEQGLNDRYQTVEDEKKAAVIRFFMAQEDPAATLLDFINWRDSVHRNERL